MTNIAKIKKCLKQVKEDMPLSFVEGSMIDLLVTLAEHAIKSDNELSCQNLPHSDYLTFDELEKKLKFISAQTIRGFLYKYPDFMGKNAYKKNNKWYLSESALLDHCKKSKTFCNRIARYERN